MKREDIIDFIRFNIKSVVDLKEYGSYCEDDCLKVANEIVTILEQTSVIKIDVTNERH